MFNHSRYLPALTVCGAAVLWGVQANAQTSSARIDRLQQQINSLQRQVQALRQKQTQRQQARAKQQPKPAAKGPKKKFNVGGGVVTEYQKGIDSQTPESGRSGGKLILDYFEVNASGQYGNLTYGAEERFSTTNFADSEYLHKGWADYAFGPDRAHHVKGGFFQVPFGNYPYGYQNFWGSLAYYAGFTDNQAAGLGYRYQHNGWRFDLDAFKNDDLTQNSLYGSNPFDGYQQINGGDARLGYTFNAGGDNTVNVSIAGRGGQLEVGDNGDPAGITNGTRWAGTAAVDAELGNWTLQGQFVDYRYNIPGGYTYDGAALPTGSITFENYGFAYQLPAAGQLYGANAAYTFNVDLGPINKFQIYDNYGYLSVGKIGGSGHFNSTVPGNGGPNATGDIQLNVAGAEMVVGPVSFWADFISGKNAAMGFDGPNDGDWHHRFNLTAAIYFNGDVVGGGD